MLPEWALGFARRVRDRERSDRRHLRLVWGKRPTTRYDRILSGLIERRSDQAFASAFGLGAWGGMVAALKYGHNDPVYIGFMTFAIVTIVLMGVANATASRGGATSTILTVLVLAAAACPAGYIINEGVGLALSGTMLFTVMGATLIDCGGTRLRLMGRGSASR